MKRRLLGIFGIGSLLVGAWAAGATGAERKEPVVMRLGPGVTLTAPGAWLPKVPKVKLIEYEFAVPATQGDKADGRVTVMTAGGSVEANIQRWLGQFTQADGASTRDSAKIEHKKIAGRNVHIVEIAGTYRDAPGPFAPPIERPGYRMLGAVIETEAGNYFIKFYGPDRTVAHHAKEFRAMLEGMK